MVKIDITNNRKLNKLMDEKWSITNQTNTLFSKSLWV